MEVSDLPKDFKSFKPNSKKDFFRTFLMLIISGVGMGLLVGSTLMTVKSYLHEERFSFRGLFINNSKINNNKFNSNYFYSNKREPNYLKIGEFRPTKEITSLSNTWQEIASEYPDIKASGYMLILDNGHYADLNSEISLPAASSIKVPILAAVLQMVDRGQIKWNDLLELTQEDVAGGAGWMAFKPIGTVFPVHDVATEMIRISDNTATNILIRRLGGLADVNSIFSNLDLSSTRINNLLPDLDGTNLTTVKDLSFVIALVETGRILGPRARDIFREVMSTSVSNRLIPGGLLSGLGSNEDDPDQNLMIRGFRVYNKTGDIGIAYADSALIELPDARRAVASFIVKGPFNDPRSIDLIRRLSSSMSNVFTTKSSSEP